jgi:hypothetical protein
MSGATPERPRRTRWLALLAAAAFVWIAAGIAVPLFFGQERVRREVERLAGEVLGRPVTVEQASVSVWTGPQLRIAGLGVGAPPGAGAGEAWTGSAESGSIRLAILPLLRGAMEARSIRVRGAAVDRGGRVVASEVTLDGSVSRDPSGVVDASGHVEGNVQAPTGRRRLAADVSLTFDGRALRVSKADLTLGILSARLRGGVEGLDGSEPKGRFEGEVRAGSTVANGWIEGARKSGGPRIDFELRSPFVDLDEIVSMLRRENGGDAASGGWIPEARAAEAVPGPPWPEGLAAEGRFEADAGRLQGITWTQARLPLRLDRGVLSVADFSCALHGGNARGGARITLQDPRLPFHAEVRLDGVEMASLAAEMAPERGRVLQGTGQMRLVLDGAAAAEPLSSTLRGSASLAVRDGALTSVGLMKQAASFLEMAGGKGIGADETPFRSITASFEIAESRARTDDLSFRSEDLDLDGGGTIGFDGALGLDVRAAFSPAASRGIVERTPRLAFRVGEDGRLTIPMKIRGSLETPFVQIDLERVLEEGLQEELRKRGEKGLLRKLLGR